MNEVLNTRHRLSEYNVYHEGDRNICITPFLQLEKEPGYNKKQHRHQAEEYAHLNYGSDELNSYFVHTPVISFRDPPRTLRRGNKKQAKPICMLNCSSFWTKWTLQFGDNLEHVLDPRGVVKWEHRSNANNSTARDDRALKGHRLRSWRLWGESGREYHHSMNSRRKGIERAAREEQEKGASKKDTMYGTASATFTEPEFQPAIAEESVRLTWEAPISTNTRRYRFEYARISFFWEGTKDLNGNDKWSKRLMPFSHLKLVAKLPGQDSVIFVGQYTSSLGSKKFGQLRLFDSVISSLLDESGRMRQVTPGGNRRDIPGLDIRETRLYEMIMGTAMCMVIGEWEKRMVAFCILMLIVGAGDTAN